MAKRSGKQTKTASATPPTPDSPARARVGAVTREERVNHIVELMVSGLWVTGKTAPALAKDWGVVLNTVEQASAEASRRIKALIDPRERQELKARFLAKLEGMQAEAMRTGKIEAARGLMELEGKTLGFFEPERVQISGNLGDLLQLGLTPGSQETP